MCETMLGREKERNKRKAGDKTTEVGLTALELCSCRVENVFQVTSSFECSAEDLPASYEYVPVGRELINTRWCAARTRTKEEDHRVAKEMEEVRTKKSYNLQRWICRKVWIWKDCGLVFFAMYQNIKECSASKGSRIASGNCYGISTASPMHYAY